MKNYIFVGLGPHAKRIYYPFLEKYRERYDIRVKALIDLDSQSEIIADYLNNRTLRPEKIVYLPDNEANRLGRMLDATAEREMTRLAKTGKIDGIIISTEPKAHKIYAEWALKNNINVLMDKPITAPLHPSTSADSARQIYRDYLDLKDLHARSKAKFYVVCQRRNHGGYTFIHDYLKNFVGEFKVPISYIDVYHADGAWNLPHEFMKENHPYKYGYGKLMHSGYHFVDLFAWLAQINFGLERARPDSARVHTARFTPNDLFNQIDESVLAGFFGNKRVGSFYRNYRSEDYDKYGELDAYTLVQLMRGRNAVTTGTINLQQNSFSRRGWFDLPADTYKGNGRVRHERVNIQVSQFLNVQVHSYQSAEAGKRHLEPGCGVGSEDHFDVFIFRNNRMVGGPAFQKFSVGENMKESNVADSYYLGHNERARELTLLNFIEGKDDGSELAHHQFTNQLLSNIYESMAQGSRTGNSQLTFKI